VTAGALEHGRGRRILLKVGGAHLADPGLRTALAQSVASARADGHVLILVHGGGPQIRALSARLGLEDRYHDGLRITDRETAEVALMTLGGLVGRTLVAALEAAGVRAVSLTGADGGTFTARPHHPGGADLGYVGVPESVRPDLIEQLIGWGAVPVVATVAPQSPSHGRTEDDVFLNINADHVVAPLARALQCDTVLFLTDVDGVRDGAGRRLDTLTPAGVAALRTGGVLQGGMAPKVGSALAALEAVSGLPGAMVKIAPAGPDAVRQALAPDVGTHFTADAPSPGHRYPLMRNYSQEEALFVSGTGAEVRTADGETYLDFLSGIGVSALGHGHPALVAALAAQAADVVHVSNLFRHPLSEPVAERLAHLCGLDAVLFTNSGTEANEAALKLARKYQRDVGRPERSGFVALTGGFHGRTFGALSVTANPAYRTPFEPLVPGVTFVPAGDLSALEEAVRRTLPAAVILEPIQGEGGVFELPADYLRAARALCTETGTVLIHDEVQSGCGRTGTFLAAQRAGVTPDVVTLSKPLAAGLPLGAVVTAPALSGTFKPGNHGSTFAGGPLALRACSVFLHELEQGGLMEAVVTKGARLRAGLTKISADFPRITGVRGCGLMLGLRLSEGVGELQRTLYHDHRLITNVTAGDVLRLLPPYVVTDQQIDDGVARIRSALVTLDQTTPLDTHSCPPTAS
jgi:acetylornithine/N-succinyldiaminopimelate aminotransferase